MEGAPRPPPLKCFQCGEKSLADSSIFGGLADRLLPCDCFLRYVCASCGASAEEELERLHVLW